MSVGSNKCDALRLAVNLKENLDIDVYNQWDNNNLLSRHPI